MHIIDGFKFGLGLWFATMLVGTAWILIVVIIALVISSAFG